MAVDRGCADSEDVAQASTISATMLSQPRRSLGSIDLMNVHRRNLPHSDSIGNPKSKCTDPGHLGPGVRSRQNARGLSRPTIMPTSSLGRLSGVPRHGGLVPAGGNAIPPLARTPARSNPGRATVTSTASAWFGGALFAPGSPGNAVVTVDVPSGANRAAVPSPALTDLTIFRRMGGFPARRPTRCAAADRVANTPRRRMRAASADWDQDCQVWSGPPVP
jgi:hypothetical protein